MIDAKIALGLLASTVVLYKYLPALRKSVRKFFLLRLATYEPATLIILIV